LVITRHGKREKSFSKISEIAELPYLIETQICSYEWFLNEGMRQAFRDLSPITDFTGNIVLEFLEYYLGDCMISIPETAERGMEDVTIKQLQSYTKYSVKQCRERDMTYSIPLKAKVRLIKKDQGEVKEVKEQTIFIGDFPLMTEKGTFVINGAERVIVSQLVRSPGVYFQSTKDKTGKDLFTATVIPDRGAWLELASDIKDIISVRIDRTRKLPATVLLRALGYESNEEILKLLGESPCVEATLAKDSITNQENALVEIYKKLRPGDPPTLESAQNLLNTLFFNPRRYNLGYVGRYKLIKKLSLRETCLDCGFENSPGHTECARCEAPLVHNQVLTNRDIVEIIGYLVGLIDARPGNYVDDIDHLGNRRVRAVGELLLNQFHVGLLRLERVVRERMTVQDAETVTPQALINIRPVVAVLKEFFGSSQLSQFMDQTNSLAELTHKRRLSALGPGGLSRERAGFEVRDVHHSHYGRICPIETPEGPNIGLIGSMACYSKVNKYGFIETPYRKVLNGVVTDEVVYMTADEEDKHVVAQANAALDEENRFVQPRIASREKGEITTKRPDEIHYIDVSPKQIVSVATALIPFLEHDDANRALMGANMQRQGVPLLVKDSPLVGTGIEYRAARDSGCLVVAEQDGIVKKVTANEIIVEDEQGQENKYDLLKFIRSNAGTCVKQDPIVHLGEKVHKGEVLADGSSSVDGELALGRNVLVAFMPWEGYNYEDAILVSEEFLIEDLYTSIHIEEYDAEARDTKLGSEEITREIPSVGDDALKNLDERGIIRVGADVRPEDILVGKVTPKGETDLTAEERLLRAIFGEKARDVRDTSLRVPHGEKGKVIDVKVFSREDGDELSPGINKLVRVYVAQKRKILQGDKMAGRHGNKGVVAKILPKEDMPYLPDGTPIQIVLNPLGVPSRMNIGQVLETHLGWAVKALGIKIQTPVFDGANEEEIRAMMRKAGLPESGKSILYDGRTGEPFDQEVMVGHIYMMKLAHLVDDKIHARSTGPYSLVTQQPLGGKAQFGGQRFGEMEVWALESYGAAYTLQELLTVKSDDVVGRVKTYEAIVKGENVLEPGVPESFKVLIKELQSLALDVKVYSGDDKEIDIKGMDDELDSAFDDLGLDLSKPQEQEAEPVHKVISDDE